MKRLLLYIVILTVLFSGGIAVTSAMGRTAPPPAFAQWFTYPDGSPCPMPCLFGIRPGVTKWEDLAGILQAHSSTTSLQTEDFSDPNLRRLSTIFYFGSTTDSYVGFTIERSSQDLVEMLKIDFMNTSFFQLYFGELLAGLGIPQRVLLAGEGDVPRSNFFTFFDAWMVIEVNDSQRNCSFKPSSKVESVTIYSGKEEFFSAHSFPWIGTDRNAYIDLYLGKGSIMSRFCNP